MYVTKIRVTNQSIYITDNTVHNIIVLSYFLQILRYNFAFIKAKLLSMQKFSQNSLILLPQLHLTSVQFF